MTATATTAQAAPEIHRPTPTQAFRELAMAVAQRSTPANGAEVKLARNREGIILIEVADKGEVIDAVGHDAEHEFDRLCAKYPYQVSNGGTE